MSLLALVLLAQAQRNPYQFPIEEPALPGQREMIYGLSSHPQETVGLYHSLSSAIKPIIEEQGTLGTGTTIREVAGGTITEEERVGSATWSVKPAVFGDQVCRILETEGFRNVRGEIKLSSRTSQKLDYRTFQKRTYIVSDTGKLLSEESIVENPKVGRVEMAVKYGEDSYDLTLVKAGKKTTSTVNPGFDMSLFHAIFTPMLKGNEILLKEKEFVALDPYTGGPIKYRAKISGRFGGKFYEKQFQGHYVDITSKETYQRAYISYDGVFLKVEQPKGYYLHIEQKPERDPVIKHRTGG